MAAYVPQQGDMIAITFDPQSGHEQSVDFRSRRAKRIDRGSPELLSEVLSISDACIY